MPSLIGVRRKIERAEHHLADLKAAIDKWGTSKEGNNRVIVDHQPKGKQIILRHGEVMPDDIEWAIIAGDVVHNLRSALDHMVCQLSILNDNDISCCRDTYFPICICKSDFTKAHRFVEPLLSPEAFAAIQELQPYNAAKLRGVEPSVSNLWILSQLDIIDKHRMLVIIGKHFRATAIAYRFNDGATVNVPVDDVWRPLRDGAEMARIDISKLSPSDNDKMHLQCDTEVQVFFRETGCGVDGIEVISALEPCIRHVEQIVEFFNVEFFAK